jgi:hypothetical protein
LANSDWNQGNRSEFDRQNYGGDERRWRSSEGRRSPGMSRDSRDDDWSRMDTSGDRSMNTGYGRSSYGYEGTFGQGPGSSTLMERDASRRGLEPAYRDRDSYYRDPYRDSDMTSGARKNYTGRGPKGWKRSDQRIQEEVCEMLARDPRIDATETSVSVQEGIVTLSGSVEDRTTKRMAEDAIENISGVKDIRNELSVNQGLFEKAKDQVKEAFTSEAPSKSAKVQRSTGPSARR